MSCLPIALIKSAADRRIHAAGQGQQHLLVADLRLNGLHLLVDERLCQFGRGDALHVVGTLVGIHAVSFFSSVSRAYSRSLGFTGEIITDERTSRNGALAATARNRPF